MAKKEKKIIAPNECSLGRWIGVLALCAVIGLFLSIPSAFLVRNQDNLFLGIPYKQIVLNYVFAMLFVGFIIALKVVGKTSVKDFVLGVGGKLKKKECLIVLGLYLLGVVISYLPVIGNIKVMEVDPKEFAFLIVFMLVFVWTQSTLEEFLFRGILLRWACGNKVGFTKKAIIVSVLTSLVFGIAHGFNPEVTSQSGLGVVIAIISYTVTGFLSFFITLYFGSLMPAIVIHWVNNFILSTLIGAEVSAYSVSTLLVDTTTHTAQWMVISNFVPWLPLLVYIFLDYRKKKKTACEN